MKYIFYTRSNEKGSALVLSVLILLLLTIIGIAATNTSTIEILISGNDKVHKMAFHQAEGGTEVGIELLEQNISLAGFTTPNLYLNITPGMPPSDTNRDAYLPRSYGVNGPHTNLRIGGNPELSTGGAIQMAAGYEGIGKSSAGGGSCVVYDIWSQHIGRANSEAIILLQWRHVM
ncbi:MAG: hypothetical protein JRJ43_11985 [Deltaproteobacteria bacterium]|nr:hypothetical protein [Deltaproteobacteria bacterium]